MVVTHSPQVAARAGHHWVVSKSSGGTRVIVLDKTSREEEIARMLSGAEITTEARAAAVKLLEVS
jgi:DNA repair protein RecN (Recombination protein N)